MKILSVSTDEELSRFRQRVLELAGHEVISLLSEKDALEAADRSLDFEVVLICHRFPDAAARKFIRLWREKQQGSKIVYIAHIYGEWPEVEADRYVVGADGPDVLVRVVGEAVMA